MHSNSKNPANMLSEIRSIIGNVSSVDIRQTQQQGLCLRLENDYGSVVISVFGGHVISYISKSNNKERLWVSKRAVFDGKTPIRGGIPICWPWFSSHATQANYPSHGYARTQFFTLVEVQETTQNSQVTNTKVILRPSKVSQYGYSLIDMKLVVTLSETLTVDVITTNEGDEAIALTQALHSYFLVDDINHIKLYGVDTPFDDKLTNTTNNTPMSNYKFTNGVDRIHLFEHAQYSNIQTIHIVNDNNDSPSLIHCTEQSGHDSTVIWNPWIDKSTSMDDMENNGYKTMLCIEAANTANAQHPLILAPHQSHRLSQKIL